MSFESKCNFCLKIVQTKSDQSQNIRFTCSKECDKNLRQQNQQKLNEAKYGPKVVPKYPNSYIPYIVLYFLPSYWFQNDVLCDKCHIRFYSDSIPSMCESCVESIPIITQCVNCDKNYSETTKKIKQKNGLCTECFNNSETEFVCNICNITFTDTHNSYNDLNQSICKMCRSSNQIKKKYLHNYVNNNTINMMLDVNQNKKIRIYFSVCDESHNDKFSEVFPLMNEFDVSNSDLLQNEKFTYYYIPYTQKNYTITNYEII